MCAAEYINLKEIIMSLFQSTASALALTCAVSCAHAQLAPSFEYYQNDASGSDAFGLAVATNGQIAAIGALFHNNDQGAVYVYDLETNTQLHKLVPDTVINGDDFGRSVVVNDQYVVASSIWNNENGTVFVFDIETGELVRTIVASDGNEDDRFGASLAIDGNILAVGCPYDDWAGDWSGSVYVFDLSTGEELVKFEWSETKAYDTYGIALDIQDELLLIGASGESSLFDISGVVYLMNWQTGELVHELYPEDPEEIGKFGQGVGLTDSHAIVGAPSHDTIWGINAGAAYIFDLADGKEQYKLEGSQGQMLGFFGEYIETDADRAVIGQWYGITGGQSQGTAYIYQVSTGEELEVLTPPNGIDYDFFGSAVAIHEDSVLVGAYASDRGATNSGSVYHFELAPACLADLNTDGSLDFFDVSLFVNAIANEDPIADFDGNDRFNFFDVSAFLASFSSGCP